MSLKHDDLIIKEKKMRIENHENIEV